MNTTQNSKKAIIFLPILVVMVAAIYVFRLTASTYFFNDIELPKIQGYVLKEPQKLTNIHLTDHLGNLVNQSYFLGKWRFITYGYTHCPDICPTTLFMLTQLADLISASHEQLDSQFIFYTIDPNRDSQKILAQYIGYFSGKFVALRASTSVNAKNFQQSLGIKVEISRGFQNEGEPQLLRSVSPISAKEMTPYYRVYHGLAIMLINPDAELQAVFLPEMTELGIKGFTAEDLYHDYLQVIEYYQQEKSLEKNSNI